MYEIKYTISAEIRLQYGMSAFKIYSCEKTLTFRKMTAIEAVFLACVYYSSESSIVEFSSGMWVGREKQRTISKGLVSGCGELGYQ